ncbi:MAG TPA: STAS domain-containing protein [Jiangellaceae bacterium]|jgi:anti-sigma B factor antagonist|nr:STAS domain-containing protein [Jiangellaceae bacterium]
MSESSNRRAFSGELHPRTRARVTAKVAEVTRDHTVVKATGEIDFQSYQPLLELLTAQLHIGRSKIVLDLDAVSFCDSSGLGMFVSIHRRAGMAGGWLRLARPNPHLRRILAVTNLDRLFGAYDTVEAAAAP